MLLNVYTLLVNLRLWRYQQRALQFESLLYISWTSKSKEFVEVFSIYFWIQFKSLQIIKSGLGFILFVSSITTRVVNTFGGISFNSKNSEIFTLCFTSKLSYWCLIFHGFFWASFFHWASINFDLEAVHI